MDRLDTMAAVETPERVRFRYRIAGPGRRAIAWFIDATLRGVVLVGVILVAAASSLILPGGVGTGATLLAMFLLEWAMGAIVEWLLGGRTPGKWALGLRVVRTDGSPATFQEFALRNLLRSADWLPGLFGVGLTAMWFDDRFRRIGDLVAGTVVVVEDREHVLAPVTLSPPVSEAERQAMPPGVALRAEEIRVIEAFLRRLPRLGPERAEELAALYGPTLADRTGVKAPGWTRTLALAYARATGLDRP